MLDDRGPLSIVHVHPVEYIKTIRGGQAKERERARKVTIGSTWNT